MYYLPLPGAVNRWITEKVPHYKNCDALSTAHLLHHIILSYNESVPRLYQEPDCNKRQLQEPQTHAKPSPI